MVENVYEEMKLVKDKNIDNDAVMKYLSTAFADAKWNDLFKSTFETCLNEVNEKLPEIEKKLENAPYNIKKDQCNVKFLAVTVCVALEVYFKVRKNLCRFIKKLILIFYKRNVLKMLHQRNKIAHI